MTVEPHNTLNQLQRLYRTQSNARLARLRQTLGEKICTACGYCMPCPEGVDIPLHMGLFRNWKVLGRDAKSKEWPGDWVQNAIHTVPEQQRVTKCNKCGQCEEKCPNELSVRDTLDQLAELFSK